MSMMNNHISGTITLLVLLLFIASEAISFSASTSLDPITFPGCKDHCGNISIPYPFGIGPNCSHNPWFQIFCDESSNPPRAFSKSLKRNFIPDKNITDVEIIGIDIEASPLQPTNYGPPTSTLVATRLRGGITSKQQNDVNVLIELDMRGSPFVLMGMQNSLVVSGCGGSAVIRNSHQEIVAGCSTVCSNLTLNETNKPGGSSSGGGCYGIGCCQTSVATSLDYFQMEYLTTVLQGSDASDWISAALVNSSYIEKSTIVNTTFLRTEFLPAILQWAVPDLPIHSPEYSNSQCELDANLKGYACRCKRDYYRGNPYLPNGCQVIKECKECTETCSSAIAGNTRVYRCPPKPKKSPMLIALGIGISLGSILLYVILYGFYRFLAKRKDIKQKQSHFKRNGGLLLQQQMSTISESSIERTKVFACSDLERATDNFTENRVLGRGGQGTVYKGMLVDGTIVAIKKSKKVDESQLEQFINEVAILSQLSHRNVVKLLGCCLETEVPLLVFEFVPNGTLYQHIHNPSEDFRITWKMRLRIAMESAEALSYLHSSSYAPIYHRDIKTSNILLDDKYRAKVSDFGTSKTISIDQTHVTTCVQGTFGYIDPEFFQSNQYTEKSDVYSFGIVLVELITSKKPIYADTSTDSRSLASKFLFLMQNSRLYDIVDVNVLEEARKEELDVVADLAQNCLHLNGKQRPTMKEVAAALQMINGNQWPSSKQILKEKERFMVNQISIDRGTLSTSTTYASSQESPHIQEQSLLLNTDFSI